MSERTSEGHEDTGLEPNPSAKPDPEKVDPQLTAMLIDRLREGLGFEGTVTTIKGVIEAVKRRGEVNRHDHPRTSLVVTPSHRKALDLLHDLLDTCHRDDSTFTDTHGLSNSVAAAKKRFFTLNEMILSQRNTSHQLQENAATVNADQTPASKRVVPYGELSPPHQPDKVINASDFVRKLLSATNLDAPSAFEILGICMELAVFLIDKNTAYGDSALDPVRIMSSSDPAEQIRVRMDDKLSRLVRGHAGGEDALKDLVGYWVLMRVAEKRKGG